MAEQGLKWERADRLLHWYDAQGRDLPWRVKNGRADPYKVWLSEIMLQQTTVAAVKDYFLKFIALWPTVGALASADREDVMRAWAGLGYYARARNIHACAAAIVDQHGGRFPADYATLLSLPGIGSYTAAAIASIAFDQRHAAVDGNVERVISRLHAITTPLPASKPAIRSLTQSMVPEFRAGDFAQAMMDLGATICTPKSPSCTHCPFTDECEGHAKGIAASLPFKQPRKAIPTRHAVAFFIETSNGDIVLRQRPDKGLLGGMVEVPMSDFSPQRLPNPKAIAPLVADWKRVRGVVNHTFTHFHLEVVVWKASLESFALPDATYRLVAALELANEALPSLMRKIVAQASALPSRPTR
jgi:A/G-specific adenine glycosylase